MKESHLTLLCFTSYKALLFGDWVCILKYFDMDGIRQAEAASYSGTSSSTLDLSKEGFFRGGHYFRLGDGHPLGFDIYIQF